MTTAGPPDGVAVPAGRVTLLFTSPRCPAGLLTWTAWQRLRAADHVLVADPEPEWVQALAEAGVRLHDLAALPAAERAGRLVEAAAAGAEMVWWAGPDGDPGLTDALAEHLSRRARSGPPPTVEVLTGSHDAPGSRVLDVVAVMDRLRSPGGCPWDARQTHTSLLPYLLEETHEVIDAVQRDDRVHLREELGDLLLQVAFHARIAQEHPGQPFDLDDVAGGIVEKLVRRHPHVFAGAEAVGVAEVERSWEQLKDAEKPRRSGFEGIPVTLPALARGQKMLARLARSGTDPAAAAAQAGAADEVAAALLEAVLLAGRRQVDAEASLRAALALLPDPPAAPFG